MSYNGSGTFQINTSGQPVVAGTVISSTAFNALTADLATGLSTAITKDGQTTTTARIPFAAGINSSSTTDSSSVSTGSIITAGGLGVAKAVYVGTTLNVAGATTAASGSFTSLSDSGNLTFTGTGNRITGDFSNATFANRVAFQTSTTNTATTITVLPNGTSTTSQVQLYSNSDPTNSSRFTVAALSTEATIRSDISGTGTYLPMTLHTGGSESLRLSATTKAVILAGGSTSANGTGITFPATQSASTDVNTLDDYEEGTWTPVITGTSTAGTATYTTQSGTYVKIGKYVFLQMFVVFSSAHTGTGGTKVGGFPFTIGADFGGGGTITYKTAWVTNGPDFMQAEANTTFGYLRYDTNTAQADIAPNVNIQDTTGFMQSIWYLASA